MAAVVDFHSHLASIMEVLANAAVAEICQLVDDGFATMRLEISRSQRENLALKSRLRLMEVRSAEPGPLQPAGSCSRRDVDLGADGPAVIKRKVKSASVENADAQRSQQPVEPEVVLIKKERLEEEEEEEEATGCSELEDRQTAPICSVGPPALSPADDGHSPLSVEAEIPRVSPSGRDEKEEFCRAAAQQEVQIEASSLDQYCHLAEPSHTAAPGGSAPNRTKGEDKHVADPDDSLSSRSKGPDMETALDSELSNTGVKGLCGAAAPPAVKLEAEPSWVEAFTTPLVSVTINESVNDSRLTNTTSDAAELDTSSLDSCSFDSLFSSPEVARSLTAPHRQEEEPLSSSSFPFTGSFGNSSTSDSLTAPSFSNTSSDSISRSIPSGTKRVFSCQQCAHLFFTSRDLLVHQRSHAGEKIYHCHLCKKPFIHPHQLKTHQRVHTGEKPFSCTQCGKRFSQSSHIKRHMSVHTGEKRYSCSLCGKRFSQACSLKVHQAVHTGERPYSCTKCGKSFSVLGNLVRHQSVHISK